MHGKACAFVDGENMRYSLMDVFRNEPLFEPSQYLPSDAAWSDLFDWIVRTATVDECQSPTATGFEKRSNAIRYFKKG